MHVSAAICERILCRRCSRAQVVISEKGMITATKNSRARERFLEDSSAHEYWIGETMAFDEKIKTKKLHSEDIKC